MTVDLFAPRGLPHIPHPPLAEMIEISASGCWEWQGFVNPDGYGRVHTGGRRSGGHQMIHRVFYESLVGPIPDDLYLDHLCFARRCVNPDHLEPVTNEVNAGRAAIVRTHCRNGHPITDANTKMTGTKRECGVCARVNNQRWYADLYRSQGRTLSHDCECGRQFVSRRALGVHRAKSHRVGASGTERGR